MLILFKGRKTPCSKIHIDNHEWHNEIVYIYNVMFQEHGSIPSSQQ